MVEDGNRDLWENIKGMREDIAKQNTTLTELATLLSQISKDLSAFIVGDGAARCVRHADQMKSFEKELTRCTKDMGERVERLEEAEQGNEAYRIRASAFRAELDKLLAESEANKAWRIRVMAVSTAVSIIIGGAAFVLSLLTKLADLTK